MILRFLLLIYICTYLPLSSAAILNVPLTHENIQAAIDASRSGDEIVVAAGRYLENLHFNGRAILVRSAEGATQTIIDGQALGPVVVFNNNESRSTLLTGFSLINGRSANAAGGVQIINASPTLSDNIIQNNIGGSFGAGISIENGAPLIQNNQILANSADVDSSNGGAGIAISGSNCAGSQVCQAEIRQNVIRNNTLSSNTQGGGLYLNDAGEVFVYANFIDGNAAEQGGGLALISSPDAQIVQNIISHNFSRSGRGDAIFLSANAAVTQGSLLLNNTIVSNILQTDNRIHSLLYLSANSGTQLFNNAVIANQNNQAIFCLAGSQASNLSFASNNIFSLSNQLINDACGTPLGNNGNINSNPKFAQALNLSSEFGVTVNSAMLDAGDNRFASLLKTDFNGNPRFIDHNEIGIAHIDIGAIERSPEIQLETDVVDPIYTIATVVGQYEVKQHSGNGSAAINASITAPNRVRFDPAGNLFITFSDNDNQIRKINSNGIISQFAGSTESGLLGDGGAAIDATLANPVDMALDSKGNWYILDAGNQHLRKVNTSGIISSIPDALPLMLGIFINKNDTIFIADNFQKEIYQWSESSPTFDLLPDTNAAFMSDLVRDSRNNFYVNDSTNHQILKFSPTSANSAATYTSEIFAGQSGVKGYSGDEGLALAASLNSPLGLAIDTKDNIYIVGRNHVVRKINTDHIITTIAGTGQVTSTKTSLGNGQAALTATFNAPTGITIDADGIIYVADSNNFMVRRLTPEGSNTGRSLLSVSGIPANNQFQVNTNYQLQVNWRSITTAAVAGATLNIQFYPNGKLLQVTTDSNGNADFNISSRQQGLSRLSISAVNSYQNIQYRFNFGSGPAILLIEKQGDGAGQVSADAGLSNLAINCGDRCSESYPQNSVLSLQAQADLGSRFLGWTGDCSGIQSQISFNIIDVKTCVANFGLLTIPITTVAGNQQQGDSGDSGIALKFSFGFLAGLAIDSQARIYVADAGNNRIYRLELNGQIKLIAGTGIAGFSGDAGLATAAQLNFPNAVAVDLQGNILIADTSNHRIRVVTNDGIIHTLAGTGVAGLLGDNSPAINAQFNRPTGLSFTPAGSLLIADFGNHQIRRIDADLTIHTVAGIGTAGNQGDGGLATAAQLNNPTHAIADASGNIYIADYNNHRIRGVLSNGVIITIAGTGKNAFSGDGGLAELADLNYPVSLGLDDRGYLLVVDSLNHRIRQIDSGRIINTIAGIDQSGFAGDGGLAAQARLKAPWGIVLDANRDIYMADSGNYSIRKIGAGQGLAQLAYVVDTTNIPPAPIPDNPPVLDPGSAPTPTDSTNTPVVIDPVITPPVQTIQLSISKAGNGDGVVSTADGLNCGQDCTLEYPQDSQVILTATAGNNTLFSGWSGACTGTETPLTLTINSDTNCTAIFNLKPQGSVIVTIAGTGVNGSDGDNNLADRAQLSGSLNSLAFDSQGRLYIADTANHKIRQINAEGIISTFAGTGIAGYSGDGSLATTAQLSVFGMAFYANELYFADAIHHVIRKIDSDGLISTVAGTGIAGFSGNDSSALDAQLQQPSGIAFDNLGQLYIADTGNHRIRYIDAQGFIHTIIGNGDIGYSPRETAPLTAKLNAPVAIVFDRDQRLLFADSQNSLIRRLETDGTLSTVAGKGTAAYQGDGAAAINANLNLPNALAFDSQGLLYISDRDNHVIRMVDSDAIIHTVAGNSVAGFSGEGQAALLAQLNSPSALVVDVADNVYIGDSLNNRVRLLAAGDKQVLKVALAGTRLGRIVSDDQQIQCGIQCQAAYQTDNVVLLTAIAATGQRFIGWRGDCGGNIARVDVSLNQDKTCIALFEALVAPAAQGIVNTIAGTGSSGFSGDGGAANQAQLRFPAQIILDNADRLYIADSLNNRIRRVDQQAVINTFAGLGTFGFSDGNANNAQMRNPYGIANDNAGNWYIADTLNHRIRRIDSAGDISTVAGNGSFGYSGDGQIATDARLNLPDSVIVGNNGLIYIADSNNHVIRKIDSEGNISTIAGTGSAGFSGDGDFARLAQLNYPTGLYYSPVGELYIADSFNHRIRKLNINGIISTVAGIGAGDDSNNIGDGKIAVLARLNNPRAIILDDLGQLYIADTGNHRVRKIDSNGFMQTVVGTGVAGYNGDGFAPLDTQLNQPVGLALDSSGSLYIADYANHRIRQVISNSPELTITLTGTGQGQVNASVGLNNGINCGDNCAETYPLHGLINLSANPNTNSVFMGWTGACNSTDNPLNINIHTDITCDAVFDLDPATLVDACLPIDNEINVDCNGAGLNLIDVNIAADVIVYNARFSGTINNLGHIINATFADNTAVIGGELSGILRGSALTSLTNAHILADSQLTDILVGLDSQLDSRAQVGSGVRFNDRTGLSVGVDLTQTISVINETCVAVPQIAALDLSQSVFITDAQSILTNINQIELLTTNNWQLQQSLDDGFLQLDVADIRLAARPVRLLQTGNNIAKVSRDSQNKLRLTHSNGLQVLTVPAVQDLCGLHTWFSQQGLLGLNMTADGQLHLAASSLGQRFVFRPDLFSYPNTDEVLGVHIEASPLVADLPLAYFVFSDANGLKRRQNLYPAADDVAAILAIDVNAQIESTGQLNFSIGNQTYQGILDYQVVDAIALADNLVVQSIANSNDVTLVYPSGARQRLYRP